MCIDRNAECTEDDGLIVSMTPVPRRNERALPNAPLVHSGILFDLPVGGRVLHISKRPTLLNQPTVQIFASEVTCGECSPINVSAVRCTFNTFSRDMRHELITGVDAAGPMYTIRVEADLICLGRVYAFKPDLC